jgi:hypothetical protein
MQVPPGPPSWAAASSTPQLVAESQESSKETTMSSEPSGGRIVEHHDLVESPSKRRKVAEPVFVPQPEITPQHDDDEMDIDLQPPIDEPDPPKSAASFLITSVAAHANGTHVDSADVAEDVDLMFPHELSCVKFISETHAPPILIDDELPSFEDFEEVAPKRSLLPKQPTTPATYESEIQVDEFDEDEKVLPQQSFPDSPPGLQTGPSVESFLDSIFKSSSVPPACRKQTAPAVVPKISPTKIKPEPVVETRVPSLSSKPGIFAPPKLALKPPTSLSTRPSPPVPPPAAAAPPPPPVATANAPASHWKLDPKNRDLLLNDPDKVAEEIRRLGLKLPLSILNEVCQTCVQPQISLASIDIYLTLSNPGTHFLNLRFRREQCAKRNPRVLSTGQR